MSEATRAPWAKPAAAVGTTTNPALPASLQGHPPPSYSGASGTASAGVSMTRAPWLQGVAVPTSASATAMPYQQEKVDFASIQAANASASSSSSSSSSSFSVPMKVIKTPAYLPLWKRTAAHAELMSFILLLNEVVRGVKVAPEGAPSRHYTITPKVALLVKWLNESKAAIASIPPIQQSMRYGNKAFRTWYDQRTSSAVLLPMLTELLGADLVARGAANELMPYLQDAFGSHQRIDYGTGHELNFVLFLCACNKLCVFTSTDHIALVLEVFRSYILLMEEIQKVYFLEPAGSKGAWGLDDYQFLIFLWGSSQLIGSSLTPGDILKEAVVQKHSQSYLFLLGIQFIHHMKSGPFHEHSAYLHQISQLPQWEKANVGLIKMYQEEVLNKFPIVQHILFGTILQFREYNEKSGEKLGVSDAMEELRKKREQQAEAAAAKAQKQAAAAPAMAAAAFTTSEEMKLDQDEQKEKEKHGAQ